MNTLRFLAGNIHSSLKQMSDDSDISFAHVVYWVSFFANKYRYQKIQTIDSGSYLSVYSDVPITTFATNTNPNEVSNRKYFELPTQIFDMDKDKGIKYITYSPFDELCYPNFTGVTFIRTTPQHSKRLFMNPYEVPSPDNPYWYRVSNFIYLLGVECIDIRSIEIGLVSPFNPLGDCDLDAEIPEVEIFDYITKSVLDLGRFVLMIPNVTINDAVDTTSKGGEEVSKQKIISVNQEAPLYDPNQIRQQQTD
jgi:hypothetical protein